MLYMRHGALPVDGSSVLLFQFGSGRATRSNVGAAPRAVDCEEAEAPVVDRRPAALDAVPLNETAVMRLAHNAMALDIYTWLAQRLHRVPEGPGLLVHSGEPPAR